MITDITLYAKWIKKTGNSVGTTASPGSTLSPAATPVISQNITTLSPTSTPVPTPTLVPNVESTIAPAPSIAPSSTPETEITVSNDKDGNRVEITKTEDKKTGTLTIEEKKILEDGTVNILKTEIEIDGTVIETTTLISKTGESKSETVIDNMKTGNKIKITKSEEKTGKTSDIKVSIVTNGKKIKNADAGKIKKVTGENVSVTAVITDSKGRLNYKVKVNTKNIKADATLYAYKYNSTTNKYTLIKTNKQKIKVDSKSNIECKFAKAAVNQNYELVSKKQAIKIDKEILADVKAADSNKTVKSNDSIKFKFAGNFNPANAKSIEYSTSDAGVAVVDESGKIKAGKAGTAKITAKITLNTSGKSKAVKMTVKVK